MIIQSCYSLEGFPPVPYCPSLKVHDDRIVFRAKTPTGKWSKYKKVIMMRGQWLLEDKIIRTACKRPDLFELPSLPRGYTWEGPFYVGQEDVKVHLPPWENVSDFLEVVSYLSMVRKPYICWIETHSGKACRMGKAKDVEEFKHLYLDIEERKKIIELKSERDWL